MDDRTFYISELALGMFAETQNNSDVYIPESNAFAETETADWHKELFFLASKGIVKFSEETGRFEICDNFVPVLKNIFTAKTIITAVNCFSNKNYMYYIADSGITGLSRSWNRKGYGLTFLDTYDLANHMQKVLRLPEEYGSSTVETDVFINLIEESLGIEESLFSIEHLNMSIDEIKKSVDGIASVIDIFSCKEKKVVLRIVIYRRSVYYKIAEISVNGVSTVSYSGVSFNDVINNGVGEK